MSFVEKFSEIKIRMDTGVGYLNWLKNLIVMTAGIKYIISLNTIGTVALGIILIFFIYLVGVLALDKFSLPQVEAALRDGKYSPVLMEIRDKVSGSYMKRFK